jgi:hypothetical protein
MSSDSLRPGLTFIAFGAIVLGLSAARVATGWNLGPGWPGFEIGHSAVGVAFGLWGWSRLRRAKATRPDLTWWQFLRDDLITLGVGGVLLVWVLLLTPEQRNSLWKTLLEVVDLVGKAKGLL